MNQPPNQAILSELRNASSLVTQIQALRALKNEIIGHEEKKAAWIQAGVISPLARILTSCRDGGKRKHRAVNGGGTSIKGRTITSDEEEARLQAIIIVGSFALAGPAFVAPLFAGHIIPSLLSGLSPLESSPQVILQTLKTLNAIADSAQLAGPRLIDHDLGLSSLFFTPGCLDNVLDILRHPTRHSAAGQQTGLIASLVSRICITEQQRIVAAQSGLLDVLAQRLAPFIAGSTALNEGLHSKRHDSVRLTLVPLLRAISLLIKNSKARAIQFLSAPALSSAFARDDDLHSHRHETDASGKVTSHETGRSALQSTEYSVLQIPSPQFRPGPVQGGSSLSPGIEHYMRPAQTPQSRTTAVEVHQNSKLEYVGDQERPLVRWLFVTFRHGGPPARLAAAELLVTFSRLGLVRRSKRPLFALLLVPPLVRMLDKDSLPSSTDSPGHSELHAFDVVDQVSLREDALAVLAMLMSGNADTQKAAADAGAIKKLSKLLKETFDPLPVKSSSFAWAADASVVSPSQNSDTPCCLGPIGLSPTTFFTLRLREATFAALGALASEKDDYRKAVIEHGVVKFVVETLKANPSPSGPGNSVQAGDAESGPAITWYNRDSILAACGAARVLSRSVSTLRTSLMDAGLAAPLFVLLRSNDVDVQVAATAVICNLVLQFSPMRAAILEGGILGILCHHAHSVNAKLRLNSLWALKHLNVGASHTEKVSCLEELGPGWLRQMLSSKVIPPVSGLNPRDDSGAAPMKMNSPNAAGEQIDLLNAVMEAPGGQSAQEIGLPSVRDSEMLDSAPGCELSEHGQRKSFAQPAYFDGTAQDGSVFHDDGAQQQPVVDDEIAIQKEGFEIVRNLICGEDSPKMIDHILLELGQASFFELLANKLRPTVVNPFAKDRLAGDGSFPRQIQPRTEIITSICFILVHIAAGHPRHRQLLISQTNLMRLLIPLFDHNAAEVRTCCAWVVINLTWLEDSQDRIQARTRAHELKRLGFWDQLEIMADDENPDCRERSKTARDNMKELLQL